jgi:Cysteine-rich CPXCG
MDACLTLQCPYCGQPVELYIDEGGGPRQVYVEDCPVCCRPWQVEAWMEVGHSWSAMLRTSDE